jgi:hypothetical protein
MSEDGSRSAWIWAAWGCGGCLFITGLVLVALIFAGVRTVQNIENGLNDPAAREQKAKELLGCDSFPDGYVPVVTFSIPFLFDTVVLADRPPNDHDEVSDETERVFVYLEAIRGDRRWRSFAEGGDPSRVLADQGIRARRSEEIGRGKLSVDDHEIDYVSQRGSVTIHGHDYEGITTFLFIRCPASQRVRAGVWSNPDPNEGVPVTEADFSGTNADPEQIRAFISHFDFCGS